MKTKSAAKRTDEQIAAEFIRQIEADPTISVGRLPWFMSEAEWEVFKFNPERFRKQRQTSEEEFWSDMKDWVNRTGKYGTVRAGSVAAAREK